MLDRTYVGVIVNTPEMITKTIRSDPKNHRGILSISFPRFVDHACHCMLALKRSTLEKITNPYTLATARMLIVN